MSETVYHYYTTLTDAGPLTLLPKGGGRFQLMLGRTNLGVYNSSEEAFIAAVTGETLLPHGVEGWSDIGVPADLADWQKKVLGRVSMLRPVSED